MGKENVPRRNSEDADDDFEELPNRNRFVRKVYLTLAFRFLRVLMIVYIFSLFEDGKEYVKQHTFIFFIPYGGMLVTMVIFIRNESLSRKIPRNLLFLEVFIISECYMATIFSFQTNFIVVGIIYGIAVLISLTFALVAMQTYTNVTSYWAVILLSCVVTIVYATSHYFVSDKGLLRSILIACVFTTVYFLYIILDIWTMVIKCHRCSIMPGEHVFAVINIYVDFLCPIYEFCCTCGPETPHGGCVIF